MSLFSTLLNRLLSVLIIKCDLPISSRDDQSKSRLQSITSQSASDCSVPSKGYINGGLDVQFIYLHINHYIAASRVYYNTNQNQCVELKSVINTVRSLSAKENSMLKSQFTEQIFAQQTKLICKSSTAFNMHYILSSQQQ